MGVPVKITLRGQTVFLCCKGCVDKAKRNPDETLKKLAHCRARETKPLNVADERCNTPTADKRRKPMIEKIIEFSIRNRFVVILAALGVVIWGVHAVINTPVDAIPDLSENQVIVFTDWMGRSPKEIEDQITYPLSVNLQGLAGVKAVRSSSEFNFSMINIIFEDNIDFYFARSACWSG